MSNLSISGSATSQAVAYRYLDLLESAELKMMRFYKRIDPLKISPRMTPSEELDAIVRPQDR